MRSLSITLIVVIAALTAPVFAAPQASDAKGSLDQQLRSLYPPVELSRDNLSVAHPGTILRVNKPRIGMLKFAIFSNSYKDGQIKQAFVSKILVPSGTDTDIHVGDNVYLDKIEVKFKGKDPSIVFMIQACGNCDFTPITEGPWRAAVAFPFPQGALDQPDIAKIQQAISEVFTIARATPPIPPTAVGGTGAPPGRSSSTGASQHSAWTDTRSGDFHAWTAGAQGGGWPERALFLQGYENYLPERSSIRRSVTILIGIYGTPPTHRRTRHEAQQVLHFWNRLDRRAHALAGMCDTGIIGR
jgi:hypothetical protein